MTILAEDGLELLLEDGTTLVTESTVEEPELPAISLITANPDTGNPAQFATEADLFVQQLKTIIPEMNDVIAAFNFNATTSTSSSSVAIGLGSKSFTVEASKSYQIGMTVRIANTSDVTKFMTGEVSSYNSSTGALVVNVTETSGSGTIAAWTVTQSSGIIIPFTGNARTLVHTGNGAGSTNTKIRRFTTVVEDTLGCYADSATLGATFTLPANGIYSITYSDVNGASYGLSLNSTQLTTSFGGITAANKLGVVNISSGTVSVIRYFTSGSVVRCHMTTASSNVNDNERIAIERLF